MLVIERTVRGLILSNFYWGLTMKTRNIMTIAAALGALSLAGCASDGSLALQTGSITPETETAQAQPKTDPACAALVARISALRQEGTPSRLEKVAAGKTRTANVKREALAKMAELDKANTEFQLKCAKAGITTAAVAPAAPAVTAPSASATTAAAATTAQNAATTAAQAKTAATTAKQAAETAKTAVTTTTTAVKNQ